MIKFGEPLPDRDYRPRPGAYGLLVGEEGRLLVVESRNGDFYLPGGGIEPGETAAECLRREFMEETGLKVACGAQFAAGSQLVHCLDQAHGYDKICSFHQVELIGAASPAQRAYRCHWLAIESAMGAVREDVQKWAIERAGALLSSRGY